MVLTLGLKLLSSTTVLMMTYKFGYYFETRVNLKKKIEIHYFLTKLYLQTSGPDCYPIQMNFLTRDNCLKIKTK